MHQGFGNWGPGRRRHGGGYFGRGGIKFAILELLREKPRHGYDLMREIEERSGGFYSPSPGVIYPTLQALEDQDYVRSSEQEGKKVYSITDSGLAYLEGHKEKMRGAHAHGPRGPMAAGFWNRPRPQGSDATAGESTGAAGETRGPAEETAAGTADSPGDEEEGPTGGPTGGAFHAWFAPGEMPDLMKELRWFFGDFAGALQRTIADPEKIKEIRLVLREAKHKIDEIVMR